MLPNLILNFIKYLNSTDREVRKFSKTCRDLFKNKKGVEIGGPSEIFATKCRIYQVIRGLDGVNFS